MDESRKQSQLPEVKGQQKLIEQISTKLFTIVEESKDLNNQNFQTQIAEIWSNAETYYMKKINKTKYKGLADLEKKKNFAQSLASRY